MKLFVLEILKQTAPISEHRLARYLVFAGMEELFDIEVGEKLCASIMLHDDLLTLENEGLIVSEIVGPGTEEINKDIEFWLLEEDGKILPDCFEERKYRLSGREYPLLSQVVESAQKYADWTLPQLQKEIKRLAEKGQEK